MNKRIVIATTALSLLAGPALAQVTVHVSTDRNQSPFASQQVDQLTTASTSAAPMHLRGKVFVDVHRDSNQLPTNGQKDQVVTSNVEPVSAPPHLRGKVFVHPSQD